MVSFLETWEIAQPPHIDSYNCIHLAAIPATNNRGRNLRGISVFVKKSLRLSGIRTERTSFGEYVSLVLNDNVCVVIFYRDASKRTLADY